MPKNNTNKDDNVKSIIARRNERRNNRGGDGIADWQSVDSEMVLNLIATVTELKGTITFGYTRDGGAYYISYYVDGIPEKAYIRPTENIDKYLENEITSWK